MQSRFFFLPFFLAVFSFFSSAQTSSKKINLFIQYSNYEPRHASPIYNLNNHVIRYQQRTEVWKGNKIEIGAFKRFSEKLSFHSSIGYTRNDELITYNNLNAKEDEINFGIPTFEIIKIAATHTRIEFPNLIQLKIVNSFFLEGGLIPAFNISKKNKSFWLNTPEASKVYAPLLNDVATNINHFFLFGRVGFGYVNHGFFAKLFYERNLLPITNKFSFKGDSYALKYDNWKNIGYSLGYMHNFDYVKRKKTISTSNKKNAKPYPDGIYLSVGLPFSQSGKNVHISPTANYMKKNVYSGFYLGINRIDWLKKNWYFHTGFYLGFRTFGTKLFIPKPGMSQVTDYKSNAWSSGFTTSLHLQPEYQFHLKKNTSIYLSAGAGISYLFRNNEYEMPLWRNKRANGTITEGKVNLLSHHKTQLQFPVATGLQMKSKNDVYWRYSLSYVFANTNHTKTEYYLDPFVGWKEIGYVKGMKSFIQLSVMRQLKSKK